MHITEENSPEVIKDWLKEIPNYEGIYQGRGIVMVAGGDRYLTNAYASIRLLRDKGCTLPIQVWYLGINEERPEIQREIEKWDVEFVDAHKVNEQLTTPHTHLNGWECKPFAIIHSRFQHVLFLDADVFVDKDPEFIFDSAEYKTHHAIYMPDFNIMGTDRSFWKIFGIQYREEPEFESGIIFINKEKCWNALNLANKICEYGTRFYFNHIHGDKDSFRAAHHITHTDFYQEKQPIKRLRGTMVQHWQHEPIFYHRNMDKLHIMGNEPSKYFANEEQIFQYVKELRQIYNPYILKNSICFEKDKSYEYIRVGLDRRRLILGPDYKIVKGNKKMESYYCIMDERLYIMSEDGEITASLQKWDDGWIGRWQNHERCITILERR